MLSRREWLSLTLATGAAAALDRAWLSAQQPLITRAIPAGGVSNPYRSAHVRGRVAETVEGEQALELIDRLAVKYTGEPFPMRTGTVYLVEVERAGSMTLPFRAK